MTAPPIPLFVLTGFLGAGKTTALNKALADPCLARSAIIINEYGETGLDHLFVPATGETVVELANGCVCCTIRGQLIDTLADLPLEDIDRVIIETTGLADPVPVLQSVNAPELRSRYAFQDMICVVDAINGLDQIVRYQEAARQVALAGTILISKADLVPEDQHQDAMQTLKAELLRINARSTIEPASEAAILSALSDAHTRSGPALAAATDGAKTENHDHAGGSAHAALIRTITLHHDRPMPMQAIEMFCELMTSAHGASLLRIKGVVSVREDPRPLVVHCVGGIMHEPHWLDVWPTDLAGTTVVVIVDGMDTGFVSRLFAGFADLPGIDQPDSAAMLDNPLAIPGRKPV